MAIIVSYDVGEFKTQRFKEEMKKLGYGDSFSNTKTKETTRLPNTTLYHQTKNPTQAMADLQSAARIVNATVDKAVSVEFGNWDSIPSK